MQTLGRVPNPMRSHCRSMSRSLRGLSFVAVVLLVFGAAPRSREVHLVSPFAPVPLRLSIGGQTFSSLALREHTLVVRAPMFRTSSGLLQSIEIRAASPCGEVVIDRFGARVQDDGLISIEIYESNWKLFVDNRALPAASLRFGSLELALREGAVQHFELPMTCVGAQSIRMGARDFGTVQLRGRNGAGLTSGGVLVDPTGRRCYAMREVLYGARPGFDGQPAGQLLAPASLHLFDYAPDFVLEDAPSVVSVLSDRRLPTLNTERRQVIAVPCGE